MSWPFNETTKKEVYRAFCLRVMTRFFALLHTYCTNTPAHRDVKVNVPTEWTDDGVVTELHLEFVRSCHHCYNINCTVCDNKTPRPYDEEEAQNHDPLTESEKRIARQWLRHEVYHPFFDKYITDHPKWRDLVPVMSRRGVEKPSKEMLDSYKTYLSEK